MRFIGTSSIVFLLASTLTSPLTAQTAPDATKLFASSADVQALIAKAKAERKDGQPMVSEPILKLAPYNVDLEYRAGIRPPSIHEREAEILYVIEGSGTFVMGGKLVNEVRTDPANPTGTSIEGGTTRSVAKGDFILVPQGTPHWFNKIDGGTMVTMSLHVPRTTP
jgi:mannose-6-phosphate isomerase-like protein (cupin superfamily)